MMKLKYFTLLLFLAIPALKISAQGIKSYDWEAKPVLHQLNDSDKNEPEIILKKHLGFVFDYENKDLVEYRLFHEIRRLNNDAAIERNNKIYIPQGSVLEIVTEKARVINPDGQIKSLDKKDIKESEDEEHNSYRYFALDGLQKGAEIEFMYLLKVSPYYNGTQNTLQSSVPARNVDIEIISPSNLIFSAKSYNKFPEFHKDTTVKDSNRLYSSASYIPALEEEEFAAYQSNLMRVAFKLDKNTYNGSAGITSYKYIAKGMYDRIYPTLEKADAKKVQQVIKEIKLPAGDAQEMKVRKVEDYIKKSFAVLEGDNLPSTISDIVNKKVAGEVGIVRLYTSIFKELGIKNEVGLTCNRYVRKFDPDFDMYNYLEDFIIYFPDIDKYMAPTLATYRLGYIPYQWTNNHALFVVGTELGGTMIGAGEIRFIPALPEDATSDKLNIKVGFTPNDMTKTDITLLREMNGYYAQEIQPIYDFLDDDKKKEIAETLIHNISEDASIENYEVKNGGSEYFGLKPYQLNANLISRTFIEKAGQKYIFKVGELIGPQTELYAERERKLPVENTYNRIYNRKISFKIPEGYKVSNLDALNMDIYQTRNGERVSSFASKYQQNGDEVVVDIIEFYKEIGCPVNDFESYRKVINAAADFNKVVVYLEKI